MKKTIEYYTDEDNTCYIVGTTNSFMGTEDAREYFGADAVLVEVAAPANLYEMITAGALVW